MIHRDLEPALSKAASSFPIVTLTGPRQSGKSTLCRALFKHLGHATLEDTSVRAFALSDPHRFLAGFPNGAVIDEFQHAPDLASNLQIIVDEDQRPARWILTCSENLSITARVSQSLAGRSAILTLLPASRSEVVRFDTHPTTVDTALRTGGYLRILDKGLDPTTWLVSYVTTYVERDARSILNIADLAGFQKFVQMCAGRTAQVLNLSALAADCGITQPTAKAWLSVLEASYLVVLLRPWFRNHGSRLVKAPKLHFIDSGLVCYLLGIHTDQQLASHPLRASIFESWAVSEVLKQRLSRGESPNFSGLFYYRDQKQREADLLIERHEGALGHALIEIKSGSTISADAFNSLDRVTAALPADLKLSRYLIHGGSELQNRTAATVIPWTGIQNVRW